MDEEEELEVLEQVEISDDEDGKSPSFLTTLPEDTVVCSPRSTDPRICMNIYSVARTVHKSYSILNREVSALCLMSS